MNRFTGLSIGQVFALLPNLYPTIRPAATGSKRPVGLVPVEQPQPRPSIPAVLPPVPRIPHHPGKLRQPRLAPDGPALIAGLELVRRIKGAEMDLDLIPGAGKDGGAAVGAEMAAAKGAGFA